jgi:hypothetical protein
MIEHAEALGEPAEDPLLLFLVLNGGRAATLVAFNGDVLRELATQYMAVAERDGAATPLLYGHRTMGISLLLVGDIVDAQAHLDRTIALCDPITHRPLLVRFGQDVSVAVLAFRSLARWLTGHPAAALADVNHAVADAREIGHAASLMYALAITTLTLINCGHYEKANSQLNELISLAEEKGALIWKAAGLALRGCVLALSSEASGEIQTINSGLKAWRSSHDELVTRTLPSGCATATSESLSVLAWIWLMDPQLPLISVAAGRCSDLPVRSNNRSVVRCQSFM